MKPYRPSNGTEGAYFEEQFCDRCEKEGGEHGPHCKIHFDALMLSISDPEFPKEWVEDDNRDVRCTAFVKFKKSKRPFIVYRGARIYFDAVFPSVRADKSPNTNGEGYNQKTKLGTVIPSMSYFIIRQLWPEKCYVSEELAMQALHPPQQQELFGGAPA